MEVAFCHYHYYYYFFESFPGFRTLSFSGVNFPQGRTTYSRHYRRSIPWMITVLSKRRWFQYPNVEHSHTFGCAAHSVSRKPNQGSVCENDEIYLNACIGFSHPEAQMLVVVLWLKSYYPTDDVAPPGGMSVYGKEERWSDSGFRMTTLVHVMMDLLVIFKKKKTLSTHLQIPAYCLNVEKKEWT